MNFSFSYEGLGYTRRIMFETKKCLYVLSKHKPFRDDKLNKLLKVKSIFGWYYYRGLK